RHAGDGAGAWMGPEHGDPAAQGARLPRAGRGRWRPAEGCPGPGRRPGARPHGGAEARRVSRAPAAGRRGLRFRRCRRRGVPPALQEPARPPLPLARVPGPPALRAPPAADRHLEGPAGTRGPTRGCGAVPASRRARPAGKCAKPFVSPLQRSLARALLSLLPKEETPRTPSQQQATQQQAMRFGKEVAVLVGVFLMAGAGIFATYWASFKGVEEKPAAPAVVAEAQAAPRAAVTAASDTAGVHADIYFDFKSTRLRADAVR